MALLTEDHLMIWKNDQHKNLFQKCDCKGKNKFTRFKIDPSMNNNLCVSKLND